MIGSSILGHVHGENDYSTYSAFFPPVASYELQGGSRDPLYPGLPCRVYWVTSKPAPVDSKGSFICPVAEAHLL